MLSRLLLVVLASGVVAAQTLVDHRLGTHRAQDEVLYLWTGESIKAMAPGFEDLLADVYWLRTVQYFGGQRVYAQGKRFELLEPLVNIATTLDPRLSIAYRYGAVFLAEPSPVGAGNPRAAIALLEKGVAANPGDWRMRQDLGFFHYLYLKETSEAVRILNEAALVPGAPFWLRTLAAQLAAEGGERAASRAMWQAMAQQSEEGPIRDNARVNLRLLSALDGRDFIQDRVERFTAKLGHKPASLGDLIKEHVLPVIPLDPSGVPYEYDPATGRVHVGRESTLYRRMYERP